MLLADLAAAHPQRRGVNFTTRIHILHKLQGSVTNSGERVRLDR